MLVTLPSPISELQHALLPLKVLRPRERALIPCSSAVFRLDSHLSPSRSLGVRQVPTTDNFLTTMFRASLQSYLRIVNVGMKRSTLQQHKETTMLCEKGMTIAKARSALLVPQNIKHVILAKT